LAEQRHSTDRSQDRPPRRRGPRSLVCTSSEQPEQRRGVRRPRPAATTRGRDHAPGGAAKTPSTDASSWTMSFVRRPDGESAVLCSRVSEATRTVRLMFVRGRPKGGRRAACNQRACYVNIRKILTRQISPACSTGADHNFPRRRCARSERFQSKSSSLRPPIVYNKPRRALPDKCPFVIRRRDKVPTGHLPPISRTSEIRFQSPPLPATHSRAPPNRERLYVSVIFFTRPIRREIFYKSAPFNPRVSSSPNIKLGFCSARPAAPFTRLCQRRRHDNCRGVDDRTRYIAVLLRTTSETGSPLKESRRARTGVPLALKNSA